MLKTLSLQFVRRMLNQRKQQEIQMMCEEELQSKQLSAQAVHCCVKEVFRKQISAFNLRYALMYTFTSVNANF